MQASTGRHNEIIVNFVGLQRHELRSGPKRGERGQFHGSVVSYRHVPGRAAHTFQLFPKATYYHRQGIVCTVPIM